MEQSGYQSKKMLASKQIVIAFRAQHILFVRACVPYII